MTATANSPFEGLSKSPSEGSSEGLSEGPSEVLAGGASGGPSEGPSGGRAARDLAAAEVVARTGEARADAARRAGERDASAATVVAGRGGRPSARERLLAAANELFYQEGVQSVGIDRVIEHAGVAKASLYNTFGSKEGLVRAYLESRHERNSGRIMRAMPRYRTPREQLLGVFDAQGEAFHDSEFNGCAFVAASAEAPRGGAVEQASDAYRGWLRGLFVRLSAEAGAPDPEALGRQLHLLYDGSTLSARMDRDDTAAAAARDAAATLLDAVLPHGDPGAGGSTTSGAAPGSASATPDRAAAARA